MSSFMDLPAELQDMILVYCIRKAGIKKALEMRLTCRSINLQIHGVLLRALPAHRSRVNKAYALHNFPELLLHRTPASITAPFLSRLIRSVTEMLIKLLPTPTPTFTDCYLDIARKLIYYEPKLVNRILWGPVGLRNKQKLEAADIGQAALVCAITLENEGLVKNLLEQGITVWSRTSVGTPLDRAIAVRNPVLVDMLLRYGAKNGYESERKRAVKEGLKFALEGGNSGDVKIAKTIAEWYIAKFGPLPTVTNGILVDLAVFHVVTDFITVFDGSLPAADVRNLRVRAVLSAMKVGRKGQALTLYAELVHAHGELSAADHLNMITNAVDRECPELVKALLFAPFTEAQRKKFQRIVLYRLRYGSVSKEVLGIFIDKHIIKMNELLLFDDVYAPFLYWCVRYGHEDLTRVILDHPDMQYNGSRYHDNIFQVAVECNYELIVQLLLEHEWDPEAIAGVKDLSTWQLSREGSKLRTIVHQAILAKGIKFGDTWARITRTVWNSQKQEDERVSYVFFPGETEDMFPQLW